MRRALPALVALALGVALRGPDAGAAVPPPQRIVVFAPLASLTEGKPDKALEALDALLYRAATMVEGHQARSSDEARRALKKVRRGDLEVCEGDLHCLAEMGRIAGGDVVLAGDVSELGEGFVVYLHAVDVKSEKELGSTTVVFEGTPEQQAAQARAAMIRLLVPRSYRGFVTLNVDVKGATVFVDGERASWAPGTPFPLAVGTHALRVTHDQYRDWVRFVDVKFDDKTTLAVELKAYPILTDEMREKDRPPTGPILPSPWYRKWWAVAGAGTILLVGATVAGVLLADSIGFDDSIVLGQ